MTSFSKSSVFLLILAGICIFSAIFFPVWRIELDAPQYPEGLVLLLYSYKVGGDVDIINGLNHYIGMKTIHSEEFTEFKVLPYILGFFGLWSVLIGLFKIKKSVLILLICLILFGVLAMYDFWRWEYEYGHTLDPSAAIIVPGMAYQPPLIGFKQLLNFGAYSIPDTGGWLMLAGGMIIGFVYLSEAGFLNKLFARGSKTLLYILPVWLILACGQKGPEPISLNNDTCAHCKMTISDGHFGAEMITKKGRIYKFDDILCMMAYKKENPDKEIGKHFVHYFLADNVLIPAESAHYIKGGSLRSPMAGNMAAFKSEQEAAEYKIKLAAENTQWNSLIQQ